MTRIRTILAAWMLAAAALVAAAPAAHAADNIAGANVSFYSNGAGHFDASYFAHNGGNGVRFYEPPNAYLSDGNGDAGVTLAIYGTDSNNNATATSYGVYGDHPFVNVVPPFLQPGGDGVTTPLVLQSEYVAGDYDSNGVCQGSPCLKVTELASYISTADDVYLTYRVDNESVDSTPVRFRLTASADHSLDGSSDGGAGYFDSGTPRAVGTVDDARGNSVAYQEVAASPWTHWQEGVPSAISLLVQSPLSGNSPSQGLTDTVTTPDRQDKAIAVQWDDYATTTALAAGDHHDFQVFLRFHDWNALALSDPGYVETGPSAPATVTATVTDQHGSAVPLQSSDVRYRIEYGPDAPVDQSFQTAAPSGPTGQANVTWHWLGDGTTAAQSDEVEVWIDLNHDGIQEPNEPDQFQSAEWYDAFEISPYDNSEIIGNSNEFNVYSYDSNHTSIAHDFNWQVTGANPQPGGTCMACSFGNAIDLLGDNAGVDHITVSEDLDNDGDFSDWGEQRTVDLTWNSGIYLYPGSDHNTQGSGDYTVEADLNDSNYDPVDGVPLYYTVSGANPQPDASNQCAGTATFVSANGHTACKTDLTSALSDYYDDGAVDITMHTDNAGEDTLTVWRNDDSNSAPGQTAVLSTGSYATTLSPDQRLTTNLTATDDEATRVVGAPFDVTTTLQTSDGTTDTRSVPIRYEISGPDATGGYFAQTVMNDSAGHATITLPDAGGAEGTDYVSMYADLNDNGQEDGNEPFTSVDVDWSKTVHMSVTSSQVSIGNPTSVSVQLLNPDSTPYDGSYEWWVDGGAHTTASTYSAGYGYFTVPSQAAGPHTVHVQFTDNSAGTQSNSADVTWAATQTLALTSDIPQASGSRDASTGTTAHVTMTLTGGGGAPAAGQVMRYEISGANDDSGKRAVTTDANGQATIAWTGVNAGTDSVHVWPDYDDDGQIDGPEYDVDQYLNVTFHDRVELTPGYYDSKYEDSSESVTVKFHDDLYQPLANKPLTYAITGANPIAAPVVTTDSSGAATISWTGNEAGTDQLVVWQDANGNGQLDAGEQASKPMTMDWDQRLGVSPSPSSSQATNHPFTINATLRATSGALQPGATLHWVATGASPQSGTTSAATDANGHASFTINSSAGGTDSVTVWLDSNGNGVRDGGEPQGTTSVTWTSAITLNCSCSQTKPEGNTQTLSAILSSGSYNLYYSVSGANPKSTTLLGAGNVSRTITLTGSQHGQDSVFVFADVDGSGTYTSGDIGNWFFMTWSPRITLVGGDGNRVAGGSVSMAVTLLDANGSPVSTPTTLNYSVTGANPHGGSVQTNSLGRATISWTADNVGTDTLSVTGGTFTSTKSIYWSAPPVSLSLAHTGASQAYQSNTHTVTATVGGVTIPAGGVPVHFSVTGANATSQVVQSDNSGVAQFTWTGTNDGTDTVSAYADLGGTSAQDDYDPSSSVTMTWLPLVQLTDTTTDQAIGEPHTETVHFVNGAGAPLANALVFYQISGANSTGATLQQARAISTGAAVSTVHARTDGSGNVGITWTGINAGTDTLDAWGDLNGDNLKDAGDPHVQKVVTWRTATASSAPPGGGGGPLALPSAVTPGSANDFDGLATPPPPVVAKSVNVAPVKGHVFVRLPGSKKFIELLDAEQIPVRSIVDVRRGTVALTSAQNLKGGVATANFYAGQFKIAQKRASKPITDLSLYGGSFRACSRILKGKQASLAGAARKKKIRQLWTSGHGLFRTKGRYASAAIRGTKYDVIDYCDGTLVKVTQGKVAVQNFRTRKTKVVKAPRSLFVPAKR